jgi:hypothetical protein
MLAASRGAMRHSASRKISYQPPRGFHLVAVVELVGRRNDGPEGEIAKAPDSRQAVAHGIRLGGELRRIGDMLPGAASASVADVLAARLYPVRRCVLDGNQLGIDVPAVQLAHPSAHGLSGCDTVEEDRQARKTAHPVPAIGEAVDAQAKLLTGAWTQGDGCVGGQITRPRAGATSLEGDLGSDVADESVLDDLAHPHDVGVALVEAVVGLEIVRLLEDKRTGG